MDQPAPNDLARLLRRLRLASGLSQSELAARAGLSVRGISNLERGVRRAPYPHTVESVAQALNLAPAERERLMTAARNARRRGRSSSNHLTPGPPLVGRLSELRVLERHLSGVGPPMLLLAGEPGIGKTRLLQEAMAVAGRGGMHVLSGICDRHGAGEPYAPFPALLARLIETVPAKTRVALLDGCTWLARLLPDLTGHGLAPPSISLPAGQERRLIFTSVRRLLERAAPPGRLVLSLDDLQWAGPGALDLLEFLLTASPEAATPVPRVIAAYRDTEPGPDQPLQLLLASLADREIARQIEVAPLDREASATLLDALLPEGEGTESLKQRVLNRAGGVPFFLLSCAQSAVNGEGQAPWSVAQSVRGRVAAISPIAQEALEAAAVAGRSISGRVLAAVVEAPRELVLHALDEACAARLLTIDDGTSYHFTHELIREVVETDTGVGRRTVLHGRFARVLVQQPQRHGAAEIALHFRGAQDHKPALEWTMRAGDEAAAALAHNAAGEQYQLAAALARELGDNAGHAAALERRGRILILSGRYAEALEILEPAAATYHDLRDLEGEAQAVTLIGMSYRELGRPAEGIARLEPAIARVEAEPPSSTLARLYVTLAHVLFVAGEYGRSAELAERAAEMARILGDERTIAEAGARLGACLTNLYRNEEAVRVLEEAVSLAEQTGDVQLRAIASTNLGIAYAIAGRHGKRLDRLRHALVLIEQLGDPHWLSLALCNLGEALMDVGDWIAARETLERARGLSAPGAAWTSPYAVTTLAKLAAWQGRWSELREILEDGRLLVGSASDPAIRHGVQRLQAELELAENRPDAALTLLTDALDGRAETDLGAAYGLPVLSRVCLRLGDIQGARRAAEEAVRLLGSASGIASGAYRVLAAVALAESSWDEAERLLTEAIRLARQTGSPYEEGLALLDLGLLRVQRGDPAAGRALLTPALSTLQRLGAAPAVQQAVEALSRI